MAHVAESKKKVVQEFVDLIKKYPIVGAVNMEGLPAPQLQTMRSMLRDTVVLRMTKRRLLTLALEQTKADKPGIEKLKENLKGMPALLFTKENPFKLFKKLKENKSTAPAKAGQTAPKEIVVKAGPTSFAPGPVIGELGALGIKCGVENGKIAIKEDSVVAQEGDIISQKLAEILTRLGIEPMEVGLDLVATYEDGTIFTKDILNVDQDEFMQKLQNAASWAFNLSVEATYLTKDNIELLVQRAFRNSKGLALEAAIMADAVAEELLTKAERQMLSLKDTANIDVTAKPKTEKKEEPKPEEKKEEVIAEEIKKEEPAKEQTEIIEKAEEKSEKEPEVKEAKEQIKEDIANLEENMDRTVKEAPKEEQPKLEEQKKEVEEVVKKEIEKEETEEKKAVEETKVPSAQELVEKVKKEEPKTEPEKIPSAHELLAQKNKRAQEKLVKS